MIEGLDDIQGMTESSTITDKSSGGRPSELMIKFEKYTFCEDNHKIEEIINVFFRSFHSGSEKIGATVLKIVDLFF
jgi:hypothetical protein